MACERGEHLVYLSLGSNLGRREENLRRGLQLLAEGGAEIDAVSGLYETEPWGGVEQPNFYNLAACCRTELAPRELLLLAKQIERQVGRRPGVRWGARVLDIDILLYDDIIYEDKINETKIYWNKLTEKNLSEKKLDEKSSDEKSSDKELTFFVGGLIIPHKEMCRRAFVLVPLLEIAPEICVPTAKGLLSAAGLLAALPEQERSGVHPVSYAKPL